MERKIDTYDTDITEGTVYEGQLHYGEESLYWRAKYEPVPTELLEQDPIYRLMRKTRVEEK